MPGPRPASVGHDDGPVRAVCKDSRVSQSQASTQRRGRLTLPPDAHRTGDVSFGSHTLLAPAHIVRIRSGLAYVAQHEPAWQAGLHCWHCCAATRSTEAARLHFLDDNASRRDDGRQLLLLLLRHLCRHPLSHLQAAARQAEVTFHVSIQKPTSAAVIACTCFELLGLGDPQTGPRFAA